MLSTSLRSSRSSRSFHIGDISRPSRTPSRTIRKTREKLLNVNNEDSISNIISKFTDENIMDIRNICKIFFRDIETLHTSEIKEILSNNNIKFDYNFEDIDNEIRKKGGGKLNARKIKNITSCISKILISLGINTSYNEYIVMIIVLSIFIFIHYLANKDFKLSTKIKKQIEPILNDADREYKYKSIFHHSQSRSQKSRGGRKYRTRRRK